ncbi:DMT family transporter [Niveispirillum cyanobacteriorum]|uniref:EamA family transporter n=1 Tax=Niveispirillum cyanobacteriorum TaxID=1612173 RepID=A0A2K9NEE0_9PROT|nr:DMT family transporter [Niveispirillum cyanobacteriorum]AUN31449.1 EamA family transporter [Niveispirillum cyanobacteriorum]GGE71043.1 peptide ABC transporter ATP-binding protein [Niveispirillum cyanobacteriorum]
MNTPFSPSGSLTAPDWGKLAPALFVLLWSTGFIGGKLGLPHAEPLTFLLWRMALVAVVLLALSVWQKAPWPSSWGTVGHIAVAGVLVHGVYLGGVFGALKQGMPAGSVALIVGLQPLLTALVAGPLLGERITGRQWLGFALGLAGVSAVVWEKLSLNIGGPLGIGLSVAALLGISIGTLYQKRYCADMDLRAGTTIQYAATGTVLAVLAPLLETMRVDWTADFVFALVWLCLVLSVGAIFLLFALIRRGAASRVASLFYMVPPVTALMAWALFGEKLGPLALGGMVVTAAGVALVLRRT